MLVGQKELCVCQLMGVLGISQPLVSRNLSLLKQAGLLDERREGKRVFYSLKRDLTDPAGAIVKTLKTQMRDERVFADDLESLAECAEFQKESGRCDMKTFLAYMEQKRKKRPGRK